jgi:asparagine synthase (glutamine-hydrolysing)
MCGIAGIVTQAAPEALRQIAERMAQPMYHRGPDAQGVWVCPQVPLALAHRRLAIQDLSPAGHQPMASTSGRFHIVFNGEIYNFKDLANELRQHGASFRGGSDTEVMLAAFETWGVQQALQRFVGMFAFAVVDLQENTLTLARDRMGEKPLYYGWIDSAFVFGSELKAITAVAHSKLPLSMEAIAAYLRYGYVPTPHCIYQGIFKLPAATSLTISVHDDKVPAAFSARAESTACSPRRYWDLYAEARAGVEHPITDERQAIDELENLLKQSIRDQCIADVPIGAFLSGGVDSSTVAALMQSVNTRPINTFTIGFHEKQFDEAPYAREIARHLGTHHEELYIGANDCTDLIREIPRYWDEPFADSSQIPAMMVARMAKRHVTVCLTGDGGDELFCGYNRYTSTPGLWNYIAQIPPPLRRLASGMLSAVPDQNWNALYLGLKRLSGAKHTQANVGAKVHKIADLMRMRNLNEAYKYLLSYWNDPATLLGVKEADSVLDTQPSPALGSFIHDAMYWDQAGYLVDDNLVKGDRSSMSASLETRLPLLDHRIATFSWRLPLHMKFRAGCSKWILREVLYRHVPKTMIERPKMGFSVPIAQWGKELADQLEGSASQDDHEVMTILRPHIQALAQRPDRSLTRREADQLWTLLMLSLWLTTRSGR